LDILIDVYKISHLRVKLQKSEKFAPKHHRDFSIRRLQSSPYRRTKVCDLSWSRRWWDVNDEDELK